MVTNRSQVVKLTDPSRESGKSVLIYFPRQNAEELDFSGDVVWVKIFDRSGHTYLVVENETNSRPRAALCHMFGKRSDNFTALIDGGPNVWDLSSYDDHNGIVSALTVVPVENIRPFNGRYLPPVSVFEGPYNGVVYGTRRSDYRLRLHRGIDEIVPSHSFPMDSNGNKLLIYPELGRSKKVTIFDPEAKAIEPSDQRYRHPFFFLEGGSKTSPRVYAAVEEYGIQGNIHTQLHDIAMVA